MNTKQEVINANQEKTNLSNDVSLKDLFERVVALETKLDLSLDKGDKSISYFKTAMWILLGIEVLNFLLNIFQINRWGV